MTAISSRQQERIRNAKVLIVGCGGVGGSIAVVLARTGVGNFTLMDFDVYEPSNMNRQIGCFRETLGRKKVEVIREQILGINPEAEVKVFPERLDHARIAELMEPVDLVVPAADDFAFSLFVFRDARRLGKTALMVVPSGTWAHVSLIPPDRPSPEEMEGVPRLATYEELREVLEVRRYKLGTYFYVPMGDWRIDYYRKYIEEGYRLAQICPTVWLASSLGAWEAVKFLSGKWKPVASPRYWHITRKRIRIQRIHGPSIHTLLVWQRRLMWRVFHSPLAPIQEAVQALWWKLFCPWMKWRQGRGDKDPQG